MRECVVYITCVFLRHTGDTGLEQVYKEWQPYAAGDSDVDTIQVLQQLG